MPRALISVTDKTGICEFASKLADLGYEIISTGGTYTKLTEAGIKVITVSEITNFPECFNGRLKTLHPMIFGGILAIRENDSHRLQMNALGIAPIDIVAVNLYPFKQTISKPGVTLEEAIENIDIGGPSMIRAAAKNYRDVSVLTDPTEYDSVICEIKKDGHVSRETNLRLAAKAFIHTADYDSLIASYLKKQANIEPFPGSLSLTYEKVQDMRYGENPHQKAAFYKEKIPPKSSLASAKQLHGKELSFNNINDTHGALELLREFDEPTVVACKHSNPCGVGSANSSDSIFQAWCKAYTADPVSIFGGIIVANREIDIETAVDINKIFVEIVLAPSFSPEALEILTKKKNIRILQLDINKTDEGFDLKKVSGGLLVQEKDNALLPRHEFTVVTKRPPTDKETEDLIFAWKIVKHTKSNGIVIGKNKQSIGIGPGQVNRIWAVNQAIDHGLEALGTDLVKGSALASDAFFPFPDCVEAAAAAGISAIIQPGGSKNDDESIQACDKYGIAMIFTGMRHFRH
ncbi:MAG: bifunctional phosphoribosylaminoimidazolecarboxamide formyltransferase/IMP cyclohydrolase [Clostridiales bacterium]|jgi:phosphoribosylaminoimidazolecarboxamide formyltransferase/IMP cyclohydrolase|nr:bifunctional phosphoribosylaminoimidazolecarboxamide formyltransferase/IMP cyclohydrolase [Clostridiales bacterium]